MSETAPILTIDQPCSCVIDTNVLLDLFSVDDLTRLFRRAQVEAAPVRSIPYRRKRAADTLLLAIALHETHASTIQLVNELERKLAACATDEESFEGHFRQFIHHNVKDFALGNWDMLCAPQLDEGVTGTRCDDLLLGIAREKGIPLITNGGNKEAGIDPNWGLRGKAHACEVAVYTPGEYLRTLGVDLLAGIRGFAKRFNDCQDDYLTKRGLPDAEKVRAQLDEIWSAYQWCLDSPNK